MCKELREKADGKYSMSAKNEVRTRAAYVLLAIGVFLLLLGGFTGSGWGFFAMPVGVMLIFIGGVMFTSVSIINGVPWLASLFSRLAEPIWNGEIIYTDGSEYKIRYEFDERGSPWFVANDVCVAIGAKTPIKDVMRWGGAPLLLRGEHVCFSEENVQTYLTPLAIHNHAASRLLVNIQNNVLRKLEKRRDENKLYG